MIEFMKPVDPAAVSWLVETMKKAALFTHLSGVKISPVIDVYDPRLGAEPPRSSGGVKTVVYYDPWKLGHT